MKKYILQSIFTLSVITATFVNCTNDEDYEIPPFTHPFFFEDFSNSLSGVGVEVSNPEIVNINTTNTPLWEVRSFNSNKYMQFSSFNSLANTTDNTWFILPEADLNVNKKLILSFDLAQGFPVGVFPLKIYYSLNFDGNPDNIDNAIWTTIPYNFPVNSANFVFVKIKDLIYTNDNAETVKIHFAFNYKGAKEGGATTTIQIDNIKLQID